MPSLRALSVLLWQGYCALRTTSMLCRSAHAVASMVPVDGIIGQQMRCWFRVRAVSRAPGLRDSSRVFGAKKKGISRFHTI
eukprot:COSAG05_NODE_1709_length_4237_cov_14.296762_1_plen_81_part_00